MFFMNIVLANVITYVYQNSVAINVKLMFIVSILWPIAFIDSRTKRIPNDILKIMLVGRGYRNGRRKTIQCYGVVSWLGGHLAGYFLFSYSIILCCCFFIGDKEGEEKR